MKTQPLPARLVDVRAAATFLAVSTWTVRRLIVTKQLRSVPVGRLIRIDVRDLESFVSKDR